jgi:hypothetical protein
MSSLSDAFNPGFVTCESRWEILQEKVPAALPSLKRPMKNIDIGGIILKVKKGIEDIPDHQKTFFYVGVVSRAFKDRLYEHLKRHDSLQGKTIAVFKTLDEGLMAEFTAIDFLKEVIDGEIDGPKIGGCWNKSEGFDSPSLITAAKSAEKISVYVLYSERPFDKLIRQVGSLTMKTKPDKRTNEKFFSINTTSNISLKGANIERHMKSLGRTNVKCQQCDRFFKSEIALEHHVLTIHESQSVMFHCKLCGMSQSGDLHFMRKHISEQH